MRFRHSGGRAAITRSATVAAIAVAFLALPPLARLPARLIAACAMWIALAGVLELLSILGYIVVFKLVFGSTTKWRRAVGPALRALGASTALPAGGLVGPIIGARSISGDDSSLATLTRSTVAFTILTNAPNAIVLAGLGLLVGVGVGGGASEPAISLPIAGLAFAVVIAAWRIGRSSGSSRRRSASPDARSRAARTILALEGGGAQARRLLRAGDWKLAGALGYYTFDNAVLWAAFHAYGRTPQLSIIIMGYLVGSLTAALPLPAGLGAVDGGTFGALVLYGAPAAPAAGAVLLYRGVSLLLPISLSTCAWMVRLGRRPRVAISRWRNYAPRHGAAQP
jgi:uncharacterized membrane protein YbhN (UPF0104 family)